MPKNKNKIYFFEQFIDVIVLSEITMLTSEKQFEHMSLTESYNLILDGSLFHCAGAFTAKLWSP